MTECERLQRCPTFHWMIVYQHLVTLAMTCDLEAWLGRLQMDGQAGWLFGDIESCNAQMTVRWMNDSDRNDILFDQLCLGMCLPDTAGKLP